jgi:hypothetical protein
MKAKTNLELHMNEIIFDVITKKKDLGIEMYTIYQLETGKNPDDIRDIVEWFANVPGETLELGSYSYHLINEYYSVLSEEAIINVDIKPIEWYTMFKTLIRLNIIPSRYSQMQLKDFMKIIRLKEDKK